MPRRRRLHVHGMELCSPTPEQARLVGDGDVIDEDSDLWKTCMHELAHVEAGRTYGWIVSWPKVVGEKQASVHIDPTPEMARIDPTPTYLWLQDAVISAVGPLMSEELEYRPEGCEVDRDAVRAIVRENDISLAEVQTEARRVNRLRWSRIERGAVDLYREYVARFARKEYAS